MPCIPSRQHIQCQTEERMNHPHDFSSDDTIQQVHEEEGNTVTQWDGFGNHMIQR